jgi:hypothetical protein
MILDGLGSQELAGTLQHILCAQLAPGQLGRLAAVEQRNTNAVDDEGGIIIAHRAGEPAMDCVILQGMCQLLRGLVRGVDTHEFYVPSLAASPENQTADTAEAVNTYLHHAKYLPNILFFVIFCGHTTRSLLQFIATVHFMTIIPSLSTISVLSFL